MEKALGFLKLNLGIILLSAGNYFFKITNGFSTGGISGVGIVLGRITNLTPATWIWILNILLLVIGFIFLGKGTGIKTVYCTLVYSGLVFLFEKIFNLQEPLTDQPFMELVYAMVLISIGTALMFDCDGSSGGTDIIALILKKYTKINVGVALLCTDFIIALSSFFVFGIKIGLFSMLGLFAKTFLVDNVIESLNTYKYFIVITDKKEEISNYIIKTMHHGATVTLAKGEYTQEDKYMIHTVCKRIEAIKLRAEVKRIDSGAFIIITTSTEIIGRGFNSI